MTELPEPNLRALDTLVHDDTLVVVRREKCERVALTIGSIAQGLRTYFDPHPGFRHDIDRDVDRMRHSEKRTREAVWSWLGAKLCELDRDPDTGRMLDYLYPKTRSPVLDFLPRATRLGLEAEAVASSRYRLEREEMLSLPIICIAQHALERELAGDQTPLVPHEILVEHATPALEKRRDAASLSILVVSRSFVEKSQIAAATWEAFRRLIAPVKRLSANDALRLMRVVESLPSQWGLGERVRSPERILDFMTAVRQAITRAQDLLLRAAARAERVLRSLGGPLGWSVPIEQPGPHASKTELRELMDWIENTIPRTYQLARIERACVLSLGTVGAES